MSQKRLSGLKTGKGFYTYPGGKYARPELPAELANKVDPVQLMAPAINVAARCISGGIGTTDDLNKAFRLAFGWPRGILEFIPDFGVDKIISVLEAKEKKAPDWLKDFYKPAPFLAKS